MAKSNLKSVDIIPHKFGIVVSPPAVVYIYENKQTKKLRKLIIPVRNISKTSDVDFFAEDLKMRHETMLDAVKIETLKKMIFLLVQHKAGETIDDALKKFQEIEESKHNLKKTNIKDQTSIDDFYKASDTDLDDLGGDTDFDDLDAPIDKLGLYSDDDGEQFWH